MTKHTHTRGFTLIELLVVIAIIGILASVVLASLNSARDKGADAAIKSNLNNARAQAELSYDDHSRSYASVCTDIAAMLTSAENAAGGASYVDCDASASAWAAKARLVSNTGTYYCVDSTGVAKTVTGTYSDSGSATSC
jgi:prepilin-type N-terminal cleavage/methylation domain-containing protein